MVMLVKVGSPFFPFSGVSNTPVSGFLTRLRARSRGRVPRTRRRQIFPFFFLENLLSSSPADKRRRPRTLSVLGLGDLPIDTGERQECSIRRLRCWNRQSFDVSWYQTESTLRPNERSPWNELQDLLTTPDALLDFPPRGKAVLSTF